MRDFFQRGWGKLFGGWGNDRPGTNHMTSGPIRGLEKKTATNAANRHTNKQKDGHGNSMIESAKWGRFSENSEFA